MKNYYQILSLDNYVSSYKVRNTYSENIVEFHKKANDLQEDQEAFLEYSEAYFILRYPWLKNIYDDILTIQIEPENKPQKSRLLRKYKNELKVLNSQIKKARFKANELLNLSNRKFRSDIEPSSKPNKSSFLGNIFSGIMEIMIEFLLSFPWI